MASVTVIGDALLDVQVAPARPPLPGGDVPASVRLRPGGQGANLAVRLARRGVEVHLACALGDDPAGAIVRETLAREGVHLASTKAADATGSVVVLLDPDRERTMLSDRVPLAPRIHAATLPPADWLVVSGYLLLEADASRLVDDLGRLTSRCLLVGCSLDPAEVPDWTARASAIGPDLLVLNAEEAALLGGDAADVAARLGVPAVVVTDRAGARAVAAGTTAEVAAPPADGPLVDTTGAGDAFAAALLAELAGGSWPPLGVALEAALAVAAAAGVAATRVAGAQGSISGERAAGRLSE